MGLSPAVEAYAECSPARLDRPPFASLGHGAAGVAYVLLRASLVDAAAAWIDGAQRDAPRDGAFAASGPAFPGASLPSSVFFGEAGVWCVGALVGAALDDRRRTARAVERLRGCPIDGVGLGLVDGTAGLLLAAAALVEAGVDGAEAWGTRVAAAVASAMGSGLSALPWLGAARGWAGVAHAALRWSQAVNEPPSATVVSLVRFLAAMESENGRWPRRVDAADPWPGWCHGSAGWAQLWVLAAEALAEPGLLRPAERAAAWAVSGKDGGAGMCCGLTGEAYAALAVHRATGDEAWLAEARRLAAEALAAPPADDFPEHSLWNGTLGPLLLDLELADPAAARMPLYG